MEETVVTGMDAILASSSTVTSLVSSVFELMTGNPLLTVFLMAGLIGTGIGVYKKVKKAAK